MRDIHAAAMAIDELAYTLDNIATDDRVAIDSYTDEQVISEAKYVLELFVDPGQGHINHEALNGAEGRQQQAWARKQVKLLKAFIRKYDRTTKD